MRSLAWLGLLGLAAAAPALAQTLMPVYGVVAEASGVTVRVPASLCRSKRDYTLAVLKQAPAPMVLVAPKRSQACGPAGPGHLDLVYSWKELGLDPGDRFVLGNPLTAEP